MTREDLIAWLENHNCSLSSNWGCKCIFTRIELAKLNKQLGHMPYHYHSKLITKTTDRDLELSKWNEVREERI